MDIRMRQAGKGKTEIWIQIGTVTDAVEFA